MHILDNLPSLARVMRIRPQARPKVDEKEWDGDEGERDKREHRHCNGMQTCSQNSQDGSDQLNDQPPHFVPRLSVIVCATTGKMEATTERKRVFAAEALDE